jgi:hypothetical protein
VSHAAKATSAERSKDEIMAEDSDAYWQES